MTNQDVNSFLFSNGGNAFSFEKLGDVVKGTVVSAEMRQQTDIDTGKPLTFDDGKPRMQLVIVLQTDLNEKEDDDGLRTIYAKGGNFDVAEGEGTSMKVAIADAVKKEGGDGLNPGDMLAVAWTGNGVKKNRGYNAPKLYTAGWQKGTPPAASVSAADLFNG